jgi:hypothetical protein
MRRVLPTLSALLAFVPAPQVRPEERKPWLLRAYDDYGKFIKLSGIDTK